MNGDLYVAIHKCAEVVGDAHHKGVINRLAFRQELHFVIVQMIRVFACERVKLDVTILAFNGLHSVAIVNKAVYELFSVRKINVGSLDLPGGDV